MPRTQPLTTQGRALGAEPDLLEPLTDLDLDFEASDAPQQWELDAQGQAAAAKETEPEEVFRFRPDWKACCAACGMIGAVIVLCIITAACMVALGFAGRKDDDGGITNATAAAADDDGCASSQLDL